MTSPFRLGSDNIVRCPAFDQFPWQQHGFGTRLANPVAAITLRQIHSDHVIHAQGLADRASEGDALVSDEAGQSVGVRTADCVPLLLLDAEHRAVAAIHAGWRGTAARIVHQTLHQMHAFFGTNSPNVYVAIGPCIQACCYEVSTDVGEQFTNLFPEGRTDQPKLHLDLVEANRRLLIGAGVPPPHIFDSGLCTRCEADLFFSYRRDPEHPGRMLSAIQRID